MPISPVLLEISLILTCSPLKISFRVLRRPNRYRLSGLKPAKMRKVSKVETSGGISSAANSNGVDSGILGAAKNGPKSSVKAKKGQETCKGMRSDPSVGGNDPFAGNPRRICEAGNLSIYTFVCF